MQDDPQMALPPSWSSYDEFLFRVFYDNEAKKNGLDPNPDGPNQKYNYRAAWKSGAASGPDSHWPSEFKALDHPNRFINGYDSINQEVYPNDAQMLYRREGL